MNRAVVSVKINPTPFCIEETDRFLRKYPNFYQYNREILLPETMEAVSVALYKFDESRGYNLLNYLCKMVEYRLLNYIKAQTRQVVRDVDFSTSSQEDAIASRIDVRTIMDSLEGLEHEVFYRYYFEDMTMKEIGDKVGRTESGVSLILKRVRNKLRRLLK